jgi:YVTN family beta-propeller protein
MDASVEDIPLPGSDAGPIAISHPVTRGKPMTALPIDPAADSGRRAWLPCPKCDRGRDCQECNRGRNCAKHWQYLLNDEGSRRELQCGGCSHLWVADTANAREPSADDSTSVDASPASESCDAATTTIRIGEAAGDLVAGLTREHLYVSTAGSVKVVNRRHHIVASIPTGQDPARMTMSADGSRLFVTGYDGWLTVIDTATNTGKTVESEKSHADAVSPDGRYLYSIHHGFGRAGITSWVSIRNVDGKFVDAVAVAGCATDLAVNPDGSRLYIGSSVPGARSGWVIVIDTETYEILGRIVMRLTPDTVAVSPDGSRLYITHYHGNALSIFDVVARTTTTVGVRDAPIGVVTTPDGAQAYVTGLHSVTVIDTKAMATEGILVGDLPRRVHISHDSARAFVTDFGNQTLWVLDTADHSVITTVDIGGHPEAVTVSPDGRRVYTTDYWAGELTAIDMEPAVQRH